MNDSLSRARHRHHRDGRHAAHPGAPAGGGGRPRPAQPAAVHHRHRAAARRGPGGRRPRSVFLYNIDDLQAVVQENLTRRAAEVARAEAIVADEVEKFETWLTARHAIPTVVALRQRFEAIRRTELDRLQPKLAGLPPEAKTRVEEITRLLVEKLLITPTEQLKSTPDPETSADLRRRADAAVRSRCRRTGPKASRVVFHAPRRGGDAGKSVTSVKALRLGTRGSQLALWQARTAAALVEQAGGPPCEIVVIKTSGDRLQEAPLSEIGGKRLFVKEIEDALLRGDVDFAVHSCKDMPAVLPDGPGDRRRAAARRPARRHGAARRRRGRRPASRSSRPRSARRRDRHQQRAARLRELVAAVPRRDLRAHPGQPRHAAAEARRGRATTCSSWRPPGCAASGSPTGFRSPCRSTRACRRRARGAIAIETAGRRCPDAGGGRPRSIDPLTARARGSRAGAGGRAGRRMPDADRRRRRARRRRTRLAGGGSLVGWTPDAVRSRDRAPLTEAAALGRAAGAAPGGRGRRRDPRRGAARAGRRTNADAVNR